MSFEGNKCPVQAEELYDPLVFYNNCLHFYVVVVKLLPAVHRWVDIVLTSSSNLLTLSGYNVHDSPCAAETVCGIKYVPWSPGWHRYCMFHH